MEKPKLKTGILGLDEMLNGGLIAGRPYLITGGPGAGKTVLCMHFLLEGTKNKEKGLYIALEEQSQELREDMATFGWDLRNVKIIDTIQELGTGVWALRTNTVISKPEFNLTNLIAIIKEKMDELQPERIVIDSLTSIEMLYQQGSESRKEVLSLMSFLSRSGATTLLTAEMYASSNDTLMAEFLTSGVIKLLTLESNEERVSAVSIQKMRGTPFDRHLRPMKITGNGIVVFENESVFG